MHMDRSDLTTANNGQEAAFSQLTAEQTYRMCQREEPESWNRIQYCPQDLTVICDFCTGANRPLRFKRVRSTFLLDSCTSNRTLILFGIHGAGTSC